MRIPACRQAGKMPDFSARGRSAYGGIVLVIWMRVFRKWIVSCSVLLRVISGF